MASLMEDLLEVLGEEEKQYQDLIELGKQKREVVIKADIPQLEMITEQEQNVASKLANLANRRKSVMNDMAVVLGKDPKNMTVTKLIGYLDGQPKEQKQLSEQRDRLIETGAQMTSMNQQNEVLLKQALEMVEFDLTLLKSMRQAPETANYDRQAQNTGDLLAGSGFEMTQ